MTHDGSAPHGIRLLEPDELRCAHTLFRGTLHSGPAPDDQWAGARTTYSPDRTLGAHHDGQLTGTVTSFPTRTAVPGGAVVPAAGVTRVGVRPDRTRRGVLTAMMRAQLDGIAARGEVLASLRASEARIYGRFGYGVATRARQVRVRRHGNAGWRGGAPPGGPVRLLARDEVLDVLVPLHERLALGRCGGLVRPEGWWWGPVQRRIDAGDHLVAAVHTGADGDDGFLVAFPGEGSFASRTLTVEDLHAADTTATAALWRFALDVDLVSDVEGWMRPLDEPLELLLADPRDCRVTGHDDETWLRLVDVPAALSARSYGAADPVLLAVHDPLLERNAGVYRLADGTAERVGPLGGPVTPDLECDVAGLAMAYLGDRAPSELVATGWWRAPAPEAVSRADVLFRTATPPWCGTFF